MPTTMTYDQLFWTLVNRYASTDNVVQLDTMPKLKAWCRWKWRAEISCELCEALARSLL